MDPRRTTRVRVYDVVRSAHLERLAEQAPGVLLARGRRYDFDSSLAAGSDVRQAGLWGTVGHLLRLAPDVVEINEPLMRPGIARTAAAVLTATVRARLAGRRATVVTYAIENRDPFGEGPRPTGWRSRLRRRGDRALSRALAHRVDRIAYGTDAAAHLYRSGAGAGTARAESTVVPAVPAPCDCPAVPRDADRVLFLGALTPRKGVDRLLAAWPRVARDHPGARLTVVGSGALEDTVRALADARSDVELVVDPPRARVHAELRRAAVLVLLSQPTPTWREQVGLPLVEALAHGCAVVTTDETGLADWLAGHGHRVLPVDSGPAAVAAAVADALGEGRDAAHVQADLPARDGRLAADDWLHRPVGTGQRPG